MKKNSFKLRSEELLKRAADDRHELSVALSELSNSIVSKVSLRRRVRRRTVAWVTGAMVAGWMVGSWKS